MELKVGDVVQLKSGGPRMVISEISGDWGAHCQWFDKAKHSSANFIGEILGLADDDHSPPPVHGQATGLNVAALMDVAEAIRIRDAGTRTDATANFPTNPA